MPPLRKESQILLLGDSCIDEYHFGTVDRISPEAPVPILKNGDIIEKLGMASNVHRNLLALTPYVTIFTNDPKLLRKVRYISGSQHLLRVDYEQPLEPIEYDSKWNDEYDIIVVSDYCKGTISEELMHELTENFDGPVFVDTKRHDLWRYYKHNMYFKINEHEEAKQERGPVHNAIVTLGHRGAMFQGIHYEAEAVEVRDVCGAGDTFLAALVGRYVFTKDIRDSIKYANKAAAISVKHTGTYVLNKEDLYEIAWAG